MKATIVRDEKCRGCAGGRIECHTPEIAITLGQCRATWLHMTGAHHGCVREAYHDGLCTCLCGDRHD